MEQMLVFPAGSTKACQYAAQFLENAGITLIDHPSPEVTHLLLDVPSFGAGGALRGGGRPETLLEMLPTGITVAGGNLKHTALAGRSTLDLLQDPEYLAVNAAITADCALQVAAERMEIVFAGCPVLILGWGRIGKCLGQILKAMGADVTIAARKETDRAMLRALGFSVADSAGLGKLLPKFRLIYNTAPELILEEADLKCCKNCVKIDLASLPGITGSDVVWAKGLPGIHAPESSGKLIADTFLRLTGRV